MNRLPTRSAWATSACLAVATALPAQQAQPSGNDHDLRVLLVGHNPATAKTTAPGVPDSRTPKLYRERTAAFEALLRYHFNDVQVVYGTDYTPEMSDQADVTIFDARPKALTPAVRGKDPKTGESTYTAPTYLPATFDRAALMIADNASRIGEPLGSKLDWL